jgi:hypothetical protein
LSGKRPNGRECPTHLCTDSTGRQQRAHLWQADRLSCSVSEVDRQITIFTLAATPLACSAVMHLASRRATTMNVLGELHAVAAKLSPYDDRPTCECCGQGKLDLIDERPDPIFAVLGMTCQTLKCDFLECGKLTII